MGFEFYFVFTIAVLALSALAVSIGTFAGMALMTLFPEKRPSSNHRDCWLVSRRPVNRRIAVFFTWKTLWSEDPLSSPLIAFFKSESIRFSLSFPRRRSIRRHYAISFRPNRWMEQRGWVESSPQALDSRSQYSLVNGFFSGGGAGARKRPTRASGETGLEMSGRRLRVPGSPSFQSLMWKDWIVLRRDAAVLDAAIYDESPLAIIYIINLGVSST